MTMRLQPRPGFAIPAAILVSLVLMLALFSAFELVSTERKVADNARAATDAEAIAESGLETYLLTRTALGFVGVPAASESTRVTLPHGYADVVLTRVRAGVGASPPIYLVRSRGVHTVKRVANSLDASRSVAEYAAWKSATLGTAAAWTSLSGLHKNGASGTLSGTDACGGPTVAGVAVPTNPGYTQNGGASVPSGSPAIQDLGTLPQAEAATAVDWNTIVSNAFTPDVAMPGGSWPTFSDPNAFPVIKVTGDLSLPGSGHGLLIVTGRLTISGNATWDGIILVGSNLVSNGNNSVTGAVVTGLNDKLGAGVAIDTIGVGSVGNGNKTFQYNSCSVSKALAAFGRLVPYSNAWVDDWAF
jgi:hypothetical protein